MEESMIDLQYHKLITFLFKNYPEIIQEYEKKIGEKIGNYSG